MRYRGQSYELEVALTPRFIAEFHAAHRKTFGHSAQSAAVEVVNLRLRATAAESAPRPARAPRGRGRPAPVARAPLLVGERLRESPIYDRDSLGASTRLRGPLVIVELSSTTYVAPGFELRVDNFGNLHLEALR
jgi:N-methylhydantoinase A